MFCKACDVFGHPFRTALTSNPKLVRLKHVLTLIAYLWHFFTSTFNKHMFLNGAIFYYLILIDYVNFRGVG